MKQQEREQEQKERERKMKRRHECGKERHNQVVSAHFAIAHDTAATAAVSFRKTEGALSCFSFGETRGWGLRPQHPLRSLERR